MPPLPEKPLSKLPYMTRWFNPRLLMKALLHLIISEWFGQYADRRLIHAALDTVPTHELIARTRLDIRPDAEGAVWIDYVADLADGFDSTYAIACLLAQESLEVDGHKTCRGKILVMGGDEVYPWASRANYEDHLIYPYERAFPDSNDSNAPHPPLFAIPGNHDWYDGLNIFLAYFCRSRPKRIGSWRTKQRRSYFAIQISPKWWIWAIDIQLAEDMDQPQADYFELITSHMDQNSIVLLCTAVPGWYHPDPKSGAFSVLGYAAWRAERANKNIKIVALLSGDTHHYSRYSSNDFGVQFITSGGGGAFLHPTHGLKDTIELQWLASKPKLLLKTDPGEGHAPTDKPACYPDKATSRILLFWNLLFPLLNLEFALVFGGIYFVSALSVLRWGFPAFLIIATALGGTLLAYTLQQEGRKLRILLSLPHAAMHLGAVTILVRHLFEWNQSMNLGWFSYPAFAVEMIFGGSLVGGLIFGIYLLLTSLLADMSHNDAFSALRLTSHKHFLRIRIKDETATIFPICLDRVPNRNQWKSISKPANTISVIAPIKGFRQRLIEGPIIVQAPRAKPVPPPEQLSEISQRTTQLEVGLASSKFRPSTMAKIASRTIWLLCWFFSSASASSRASVSAVHRKWIEACNVLRFTLPLPFGLMKPRFVICNLSQDVEQFISQIIIGA
jgi:hypothetical protein